MGLNLERRVEDLEREVKLAKDTSRAYSARVDTLYNNINIIFRGLVFLYGCVTVIGVCVAVLSIIK